MTYVQSIAANPVLQKLLTLAVLLVVVLFALGLARGYITRNVAEPGARRRLRRLTFWAALLLIALSAAFLFSNRLTGLTVSLGVAGAAVAFALQQILASAVAFLQISGGHVFRVGDRIKIGGVTGDVIASNFFLTTLMEVGGDWVKGDQYSGRIVRVANSAIYQQPIYNYSADFHYLWDEITLPIKYGGDRELARSILLDTAREVVGTVPAEAAAVWSAMEDDYAIETANLDPVVFLVANDNWMEFSLRYLVHFQRRRATKSELFERVLTRIDANADRIAIASGTYDIVGLPELGMRVLGMPDRPDRS